MKHPSNCLLGLHTITMNVLATTSLEGPKTRLLAVSVSDDQASTLQRGAAFPLAMGGILHE